MIDRRNMLKFMGATALAASTPKVFAAAGPEIRWWSTSPSASWKAQRGLMLEKAARSFFAWDVMLNISRPSQTITGFGGAFSEKGWQALSALPARSREEALAALFSDTGAAFTICRTPIGANDFARGWYSYDETDGDFALRDFSIVNDHATLIPFIKAAQGIRPDLQLWASPWSPPTWMKTNKHYAQAPSLPGLPSNGLGRGQAGREGADSFIQDDRYFDAYARYFRRYVEAYAALGIRIGTVMPQNEFNSAQPFPSCCWTPQGLARFIPFLGREMGQAGVDVMLGTLERANADLVSQVLNDPKAGPFIKGVGVQWAGKGALDDIRKRHPDLLIWGSEQECGVGANDWRYAGYGWSLMKRYLNAGASVWEYWNMALSTEGMSGWGWPQNALISVDVARGRYRLTPDYWVMRHIASQVKPGARFISNTSVAGFENQLAFRNPNGDLVIVIQNEMPQPQKVNIVAGSKQLTPSLPANSFNTIVVPGEMLKS
ncbi:MAG TPA: glycoside hydrolase family 30 protein [Sphingobium sp.]